MKLMPVFFLFCVVFYSDVIFGKLSKLEQRLVISGQVMRQSSRKFVQNETDYSLTLKF